jgi:hypothetical protein
MLHAAPIWKPAPIEKSNILEELEAVVIFKPALAAYRIVNVWPFIGSAPTTSDKYCAEAVKVIPANITTNNNFFNIQVNLLQIIIFYRN